MSRLIPVLLGEGEHSALQEHVGVGVGDLGEQLPRLGGAVFMLVGEGQKIKRIGFLIAGLDRLFEKTNRLRPVRFRDRLDRNGFDFLGHGIILSRLRLSVR